MPAVAAEVVPSPAPLRAALARVAASWRLVVFGVAFRYACYAAMTALALWNEYRPAPTLSDTVVGLVPYVPWVDHVNYLAWLVLYAPLSLALLVRDTPRWQRYMVTGGLVSLARGLCIAATALGPPDPLHAGPGIGGQPFLPAFAQLLSPVGVFVHGAAHAYLTKDLFFSGHTATTFTLLLYLWSIPRLRWPALAAHVVIVATVFFAHLHYTIDVLGAYGITFAIYAVREWGPRQEP